MQLLCTRKKGSTFDLHFMQRLFATWFIVSACIAALFLPTSSLFADDIVFTGTLVRKYYQHIIPEAKELDVFGWFLELDQPSKLLLQKKISELREDDRECCVKLGFDLFIIQLLLSGIEDKILCRKFEGMQVETTGRWPSSPHEFRPIPSYQLHLTTIKPIPDKLVELSGILYFKVFPGPPNYHSIEAGDYPEACWVLKLDQLSKDLIALPINFGCETKNDEIAIRVEKSHEELLKRLRDAPVICCGNLQHAETAHDFTPLVLHSSSIIRNDKVRVDPLTTR